MSATVWESEAMDLPLSRHARKRSQRDGWTHFANKAARRRIERHLGGPRALNVLGPQLDAYVIIDDDGTIRTVAPRCRRWHR